MAGQVYFGNKSYQTWIPSPASGMKASSVAWSTEQQLLNGRAFVRRSNGSHRVFEPSWMGADNDSTMTNYLHTIKDFADGVYGSGPFYFLDPYSLATNVLPPHWAAPGLAKNDWPALATDLTPSFITATVSNSFPTTYAQYVTTGAYTSTRKLTVIIPSGYTFYFGWHGPASGATTGITVLPYSRTTGNAGTALTPAKITAGGTARTNLTVDGTTYSYVEIYLSTTGAATVNITAMMAQILLSSVSPSAGGFISGRGTAGLDFSNAPEVEYYSAALNGGYVGMSARWVEV